MRQIKILTLFVVILSCTPGFSYIPSAKTVLDRVVKRHGSGAYQVEQDVTFSSNLINSENTILRERWIIKDSTTMYLIVMGTREMKGKIFFERLYKNGRVYYYSSSGKWVSKKRSSNFIESFFHFRSAEKMARVLKKQEILPASFYLKPQEPETLEEAGYVYEDFSRLSRYGGVVNYNYGRPSTGKSIFSGIWIEQDQFVLRKLRLKSGLEMTADNYSRHARNIYFPKKRHVLFKNHQYGIELISLKNRVFGPKTKKTFSRSSFSKDLSFMDLQNLSSKDLILEFYDQLR